MRKVLAVGSVVIKEMIRRKDFYVLFILTAVITLILASVNLFNDDRIAGYLKEVCLALIWISILVISIVAAGRQLPAEKENRTIFPLLAKPITRTQVLLGKFMGCWFAVGLALLVFYAFFAGVSAAREHEFPLVSYLQALWLHWLMTGIVIALTLLGSLVLTPAANMTIVFFACGGILLVAQYLNLVANRVGGVAGWITYALYFALPHLEFFDVRELIIHNWPPVSWSVILGVTVYAMAYGGLFLLAGALAFRRKPLN
jgi:ABC-type transport system involved in multi-copper enzyme maturation permease subunit